MHASPRSGSTYFFNVLRRDENLLCFNEAIIDGKHDLAPFRGRQRSLNLSNRATRWDVNHHFLDKEDFDEFIQVWDEVMHLCPKFPTFQNYLPVAGCLSPELRAYLSAVISCAQLQSKRPVFCEINSRGRAGALRGAFEGFHIAQYRDPLSQFGSFIRAVVEGGFWGHLAFPVTELGTSSAHPLYRLIPEVWRPPALPWLATNRAQHWASDARYFALVGSPRPENVECVFRWHIFSWVLTNLAALSYSDLALDIDKVHDESDYRDSVLGDLRRQLGVTADFSDVRKFDRYYDFDFFDVSTVCDQVISSATEASINGKLADAILSLSTVEPTMSLTIALDLLIEKLRSSLNKMTTSVDRRRISSHEWKLIAKKNRKIWFNARIRKIAERVYPFAAPVVHVGRRAGLLN